MSIDNIIQHSKQRSKQATQQARTNARTNARISYSIRFGQSRKSTVWLDNEIDRVSNGEELAFDFVVVGQTIVCVDSVW